MIRAISIHALCEEGDFHLDVIRKRLFAISIHALCEEGDFPFFGSFPRTLNFYPRPLRGGRPRQARRRNPLRAISIHALCEEGDHPSCRRPDRSESISIHALCEEGDGLHHDQRRDHFISIHALCEEGDLWRPAHIRRPLSYFYPRPLRGGRLYSCTLWVSVFLFLSTPSARRATWHIHR